MQLYWFRFEEKRLPRRPAPATATVLAMARFSLGAIPQRHLASAPAGAGVARAEAG
jgi:hypothetical protein